ncbi:MAG: hydantoinase B/oxoprolinase family protein, partial [Pirellulaceae bacterium]|nr:hydantoinase B/oxoprolinase family protein [Pirellulaceae bacterium]
MTTAQWQFWIDVGGTFTDCLARRPDGLLLRHKLLSSGVTKGCTAVGSTPRRLLDPQRAADPPGYWLGFQLRLLSPDGALLDEAQVTGFDADSAALQLDRPLRWDVRGGMPYELHADDDAPVLAIRYLLGLGRGQPIPPVQVRLGTTRGTNALLTRTGAPTALVTTLGLGDILRIGYQNRPQLFRLAIDKSVPLYSAVVEVDERVTADGQVLRPLDETAVRRQLDAVRQQGIHSLAVCLLHAYRFAEHEVRIGQWAAEAGFEEISLSSQVAPLIKIVSRGDTTVVNAYLNPVLRSYVERLRATLLAGERRVSDGLNADDAPAAREGARGLRLLTSAGGLVTAERFVGKDSILSGPAGGVVGFSHAARSAGFEQAIGFDMGGTSTDVARFDGRYELQYETEKAGVRVVAPMLAIETVAAGGGSICWFDGVKLVVGPDSAGADPGPACYGRGGPLAVTDLNLLLGRLLPARFPFPLDLPAARRQVAALIDELRRRAAVEYNENELAEGFLRIANANMVRAIRSISIAKGYDPRDYLLVAFGGAAGQHACAVADELGMTRILSHPDAGVLSAYGIGLADVARHRAAGIYRPYSEAAVRELDATFERLAADARGEVEREGVPPERIRVERSLDLRYQGVEACLTIDQPAAGESYAERFGREHRRRYGYLHESRPLEIVAARLSVIGQSAPQPPRSRRVTPRPVTCPDIAPVVFAGRTWTAGVVRREQLRPGDTLQGPAIVLESTATTVVDPGWQAELLEQGELLLSRAPAPSTSPAGAAASELAAQTVHPDPSQADPVLLEVFNNQFAGIAEQMGITLRNTASSVNVKERLDFSCAIFTPAGDLVVNAPHIPVHLGAMSETVKCLLRDNPRWRPGEVLVTNDPYRGGSHLPDVTVVTPVHDQRERLLFLTASRAHHAELGGIRPGSMPPFSRNLAEEGVLISNFKLIESGRSRIDELEHLLRSAPYPSRAVADNLADLTAQVAANKQGADDLLRLVDRCGLELVQAYMNHIQAAAAAKMRAALARLPAARRRFEDHLDDGAPIVVTITTGGERATIDFTGTGSVLPDNLNANRAIVTAAVMYVLRCLIDEEIPLNQGVLEPIELILPECLLNPSPGPTPGQSPAVVGGNVETSQRVVDCLLGALGLAAASQGTMNNLLFGDASFGYYETICGGSGATPDQDGADAVHTHMTNTRLTDPELLEQRYPVRLWKFAIRHASGGAGRRRGGCGVVRQLEFLRPLDLSILSQRRGPYAPYGLDGGQPGQLGVNLLLRADGTVDHLGARAQRSVAPGDMLIIQTPGGGGFGP